MCCNQEAERTLKQKIFDKFVQTLDTTEYTNFSLWKIVITTHPTDPYEYDGKWARDDQEKANTFAIHLFNTF